MFRWRWRWRDCVASAATTQPIAACNALVVVDCRTVIGLRRGPQQIVHQALASTGNLCCRIVAVGTAIMHVRASLRTHASRIHRAFSAIGHPARQRLCRSARIAVCTISLGTSAPLYRTSRGCGIRISRRAGRSASTRCTAFRTARSFQRAIGMAIIPVATALITAADGTASASVFVAAREVHGSVGQSHNRATNAFVQQRHSRLHDNRDRPTRRRRRRRRARARVRQQHGAAARRRRAHLKCRHRCEMSGESTWHAAICTCPRICSCST